MSFASTKFAISNRKPTLKVDVKAALALRQSKSVSDQLDVISGHFPKLSIKEMIGAKPTLSIVSKDRKKFIYCVKEVIIRHT